MPIEFEMPQKYSGKLIERLETSKKNKKRINIHEKTYYRSSRRRHLFRT